MEELKEIITSNPAIAIFTALILMMIVSIITAKKDEGNNKNQWL